MRPALRFLGGLGQRGIGAQGLAGFARARWKAVSTVSSVIGGGRYLPRAELDAMMREMTQRFQQAAP